MHFFTTLHAVKLTLPLTPVRLFSHFKAQTLFYEQYGNPYDVVKPKDEHIAKPQNQEVFIEMIAAPVNPADINTIQGVYPKKPPLPAVPGNEGVGRVLDVGENVRSLKRGDTVIPNSVGLGTWRTHGIWDENLWMKVPSELGIAEASTLTVNPLTAYRMLKDFVSLEQGDVVIQNGANSACGQYVIQLCKAWDIVSVNVVRNRPEIEELKASLKQLGATHVLTEEELRSTQLFKKDLSKAKLALNCVGGQSGMEILRNLKSGGVQVTYGGMSRNPVTSPTSALIFKDIKLVGFWMTRWTEENFNSTERQEMFSDLIDLMLQGKVKAPVHQMLPFIHYREVLQKVVDIKGFAGQKFIFSFK